MKNWWDKAKLEAIRNDSPIDDSLFVTAMTQIAIAEPGATMQRGWAPGRCHRRDKDGSALRELLALGGGGRIAVRTVFDAKAPERSEASYIVVWPKGAMYYPTNDTTQFAAFDPALFAEMCAWASRWYYRPKRRNVTQNHVYTIGTGMTGHKLMLVGVEHAPLVRANYAPDVVRDYDHIVEDLRSDDPCGRVVLLSGPPGGGKTYMVRALLNEVEDALMVLVPASTLADLDGPQMVQVLIEAKNNQGSRAIVLIVEDGDEAVVARGESRSNGASIRTLLSMGDSMLGSLLNLRVVVTTNVEHDRLDAAVTRKRRMCRHVRIGDLPVAQARQLYRSMTGYDILFEGREAVSLAEVYDAAHRSKERTPVAANGHAHHHEAIGDA